MTDAFEKSLDEIIGQSKETSRPRSRVCVLSCSLSRGSNITAPIIERPFKRETAREAPPGR